MWNIERISIYVREAFDICLFVVVCLLFLEVRIATLIFSCKNSNFVTGKAFLFLSESSGTSLYMCLMVVVVVVVVLEGKGSGAPFDDVAENSEL